MTPEDAPQRNQPVKKRSGKKRVARLTKKSPPARKKTGQTAPDARPECILIEGRGSCPEWKDLLVRYPMIDSVQREDFPEHGASFAYLAHFYRTGNTAKESTRAQNEFEDFFREIGYTCNYSGNFESRWFESIGVSVSDTRDTE